MLIVEKYGGSSLSDIKKLQDVCLHIKREVSQGNKLIVVFSAMGKFTNEMLSLAQSVSSIPHKRELDQLLAIGEMQSVSLGAICLAEMGVKTYSLNAFQAGIACSSDFQNGLIQMIDKTVINLYLDEYDVLLITGFQGVSKDMSLVTLGRGGSDTTAVALASVFNAPCRIYTDVDYVYCVDPKYCKNAKPIYEVSYNEMLEMASLGCGVLISRCVALALEYQVDLTLLKSLGTKGTKIVNKLGIENNQAKALAINKNLCLIKMWDTSLSEMISKISEHNIRLDSFSVDNFMIKILINISDIEAFKSLFKLDKYEIKKDVIKLSVVGSGITSRGQNINRLLLVLDNNKVFPLMISSSEMAISALVDEKNHLNLIASLAKEFELSEE